METDTQMLGQCTEEKKELWKLYGCLQKAAARNSVPSRVQLLCSEAASCATGADRASGCLWEPGQ